MGGIAHDHDFVKICSDGPECDREVGGVFGRNVDY